MDIVLLSEFARRQAWRDSMPEIRLCPIDVEPLRLIPGSVSLTVEFRSPCGQFTASIHCSSPCTREFIAQDHPMDIYTLDGDSVSRDWHDKAIILSGVTLAPRGNMYCVQWSVQYTDIRNGDGRLFIDGCEWHRSI